MKKGLKRSLFGGLVAALAAVLLAVSFTGCFGATPRNFEKSGMNITLTTAFNEKSIVSQTAYYESRNAIVTVLKEEFENFNGGNGEAWTVSRYTDAVLSNNGMPSLTKNTREGKDYIYFTYEKTVTGRDFYYLATTHKGTDAFWLIQFACVATDKDKMTEQFLEWADTVTFTADTAN